MTKRIVEIGSEGCYLHIKHRQLIIERERENIGSVPIEDLSAVVIDHPRTLITQACLRELVKVNVMVITSDERHHPIGLFLPLEANTLQAERFSAQSDATSARRGSTRRSAYTITTATTPTASPTT